ncbi:MFS transporter [Amycolatopsis jejuensis]|uniref:MFS transporter n=1 Tax=Amycolatopsis jejuensis TaxID=330084 RepID=UPI0006898C58|nr:MFS transporter [Amycolatopsis jejuensis]
MAEEVRTGQPPGVTSPAFAHVRKVVVSSTIGTALEVYDFIVYGLAAALVFDKIFFPGLPPALGTLLSFASFAVGFVMRPVGAIVLGHFGDKYGRRRVLIVTITGMGLATGAIGLIPPAASIGYLAPLLLVFLRLVQGFSIGGEWSGATTMVLEHAPPEKRSRLQMCVQLGSPIGSLAATGAFAALGGLSTAQLLSWGWRIPFLISFLVVLFALYMRLKVAESPVFEQAREEARLAKVPVVAMLKTSWVALVAAVLIVQLDLGGYYLVSTYLTNYATATAGATRSVVLTALAIGTVLQAGAIIVVGFLGDRYRPVTVLFVAILVAAVVPFPMFALVNTGNPTLVTLGIVLGVAILPAQFGVLGMVVARLFGDDVRYTGLSIAYNVGAMTGGLMPTISVAVQSASGSSTGIVVLMLGLAALSVCGVLLGRMVIARTAGRAGFGMTAPAEQPG